MKKLLFAMGLALAFQTNAQTYVIDTEACAGTEYIYDQQGILVEYDPAFHSFVTASTPVFYAAYETIPHLFINSTRGAHIFVQNTSSAHVNFFYRPTFYSENSSGSESNINTASFAGAFSSSNSPLNSGGAAMAPRTGARITLSKPSINYIGHASIYWDSSTCMAEPPMLVSTENFYTTGNRGAITVQTVNNGKTW